MLAKLGIAEQDAAKMRNVSAQAIDQARLAVATVGMGLAFAPINDRKLIGRAIGLLPKRAAERASDPVGAYRRSCKVLKMRATNFDLLNLSMGTAGVRRRVVVTPNLTAL